MINTTNAIRETFLDFFQKQQHTLVSSSSLVPNHDPTLLFTNAGMNQFKEIFLGATKPPYPRITTAQRCIRAGGKHNDLENVGYTTRHHTFFEMLGNFSFGDYGKVQAIQFAWELLTSPQWFALPKEKLLVTVYARDDESYNIWTNYLGIPEHKIIRIGDQPDKPYLSDNFWQMGDTGPCGPCTEIFYDYGAHIPGTPPNPLTPQQGERFIEIWNIVFMQFNRLLDGTMEPLPNLAVDTGMGLERIASVLQGVYSNYAIDLFQHLIQQAAAITQIRDLHNPALHVIADHIRACAFLIADGITPSHEGRGYVLRRIIRRAIRHGKKLGIKEPFFYRMTTPLIEAMGDAASSIKKQQALIEQLLMTEEHHFTHQLDQKLPLLEAALQKCHSNILSGEVAFKLYDTYGIPLDLITEQCHERNITVDQNAFDQAMLVQRKRAQKASQFNITYHSPIYLEQKTLFCGYEQTEQPAQVIGLWARDKSEFKPVSTITDKQQAIVLLDRTPFYAEAGGQVGDSGQLTHSNSSFAVEKTHRYGQGIGHLGRLTSGHLSLGTQITAQVNSTQRKQICCNHTATHLLQTALCQILGSHVQQKGSWIDADHLRFDFSHGAMVTFAQRCQIELLINQQICRNLLVKTTTTTLEKAKSRGAIAIFGEKYGDQVRILTIGDFSIELCGGTHITRTGEIGLFRIISETGIASGIRRIEAVTGTRAFYEMQTDQSYLVELSTLIKGKGGQLVSKVQALVNNHQKLEKKIEQLNHQLAKQQSIQLLNHLKYIKGVKLIVQQLSEVDSSNLLHIADALKKRIHSGIIVLAAVNRNKAHLVVEITKDLVQRVNATDLIAIIVQQTGGKGGGREERAQAVCYATDTLSSTLETVVNWISTQL